MSKSYLIEWFGGDKKRQYTRVEQPVGQHDEYYDADAILLCEVTKLILGGVHPSSIDIYEKTSIRVRVPPQVVFLEINGETIPKIARDGV